MEDSTDLLRPVSSPVVPTSARLARLLIDHEGSERAVLTSGSAIIGYVVEYVPEVVPKADALHLQGHPKFTVCEEGPPSCSDDQGRSRLGGPLGPLLRRHLATMSHRKLDRIVGEAELGDRSSEVFTPMPRSTQPACPGCRVEWRNACGRSATVHLGSGSLEMLRILKV